MGWKNVKEYYRISHTVRITHEGICIGSPYIHNIIVIGLEGKFKKRYDMSRVNRDLCRYQQEMDADPAKLRELVLTPDTFPPEAVTVYTYDGGDIIAKFCEKPGWPNVTHDGDLMYENMFSADKSEVVMWAKESAVRDIRYSNERVQQLEDELANARERLNQKEAVLAKLEREYPWNE